MCDDAIDDHTTNGVFHPYRAEIIREVVFGTTHHGVQKKKGNLDVKIGFLESTAGKNEKMYRKNLKTDDAIE